jgi:hypothetical protein
MHLNLDVNKVNIKAVTGGIIVLEGTSNQDVVIMTGGILESKI